MALTLNCLNILTVILFLRRKIKPGTLGLLVKVEKSCYKKDRSRDEETCSL